MRRSTTSRRYTENVGNERSERWHSCAKTKLPAGANWLIAAIVFGGPAFADQAGGRVEREEFPSPNGRYVVTVDPKWNEAGDASPELSLRDEDGQTIWTRVPQDFEDFYYPLHVSASDDGQYLVFGTSSVHNMIDDGEYREGIRIYRHDGSLVRFISRRDLRPGDYGVSTASWLDYERSHIRGDVFYLFTPGESDPVVLALSSGRVVRGRVIPGQGDDSHWDFGRKLQGLTQTSR